MGNMGDYSNMIGKKYGKWTALEIIKCYPVRCRCVCECGVERDVLVFTLIDGRSTQCAPCSRIGQGITHNMSKTRIYNTWSDMIVRCNSKNGRLFKHYAGRGISVCEEWKHFEPFYEWAMANGYTEELTIDRIDNDGNYEPSNCRWVTMRIQMRNQRKTLFATINGEKVSLSEISETTGLSRACLKNRYYSGIRDEGILAPSRRQPKPNQI